jgi:hypothetical protein
MVMGRRAGRPGTGSVSTTWRRDGVTGSSTPASSPTRADQAPAAQISVGVSTTPLVVTTPVISSPATRTSSSSQPVSTWAPWRRAPAA